MDLLRRDGVREPFFSHSVLAAKCYYLKQREIETPWPLALYHRCKRYNALPLAGGLLEQPQGLMDLMTLCANAEQLSHIKVTDMTKDQADFVNDLHTVMRELDSVNSN